MILFLKLFEVYGQVLCMNIYWEAMFRLATKLAIKPYFWRIGFGYRVGQYCVSSMFGSAKNGFSFIKNMQAEVEIGDEVLHEKTVTTVTAKVHSLSFRKWRTRSGPISRKTLKSITPSMSSKILDSPGLSAPAAISIGGSQRRPHAAAIART